jgi:hypothetical protein
MMFVWGKLNYKFETFFQFYVTSQPNYVPPSIDGCSFEVQTMDGDDEVGGGRGMRRGPK